MDIERKRKQIDYVLSKSKGNETGVSWMHREEFPEGVFDLPKILLHFI